MNKPMIGVAFLVLAAAAAGWYLLQQRHAVPPPAAMIAPPPLPADTAIEHPVPAQETAPESALPALNDSDAPLREALAGAVGTAAVAEYLVPENIVRRIVVTVDNLPRQKAPAAKRPTVGVGGSFVVQGDELHATLDAKNFERYRPMVAAIAKLDMQQLAAVYARFYPLFQRAYQDLGYPKGYFNDRLVQVIDSLLATPQPQAPIELSRPNVMYTFADPALEACPAGQKLLLRMGPDNAATIKAKLAELRVAIIEMTHKR